MKIIVTGANGFVGTEAVRQLAAAKHQILALDSLRYGPWRIDPPADSGIVLAKADLRDEAVVQKIIDDFRPDAIIHLAAIHFIPECERLPHEAVSINIGGTVNLLAACPEGCRFVFASTAAVYEPLSEAHRETSPIGPMDVYGITKLSGEHFVRYYAKTKGLEAVIIRLFNVVGPGETNPHLLPEIIKQLQKGVRSLRLGNTSPKRDYIFVADAAAGFIAAATGALPADVRPVIANLGTGVEYSVSEIVERLSVAIGEPIAIETDPSTVCAIDRPHLRADNGTMRSVFGWAPRHDIDKSLAITLRDPRMIEQLLD